MKKVIVFLLLGLLLCTTQCVVYEDEVLIMFEKEGECVTTKQLRVYQSLGKKALTDLKDDYDDYIIALLINNENKLYYDNEKINIPEGKCAKQVGIYNYKTKFGDYNTVPVVIIK